MLKGKIRKNPKPVKRYGCDLLTIKGSLYLTSVGFEMSLYPVVNRIKINIMYLKTLRAGHLKASNIDSFTGENSVLSA